MQNIFTIYHNPRCSKSREALEMLKQHQIIPTIIEYLRHPLDLEQVKKLRTHFDLKNFIRYHEPLFHELNLSLENEPEVLCALVKHPILMQRPIITYNDKAIIGRPLESLLTLINKVQIPYNKG